MALNKITYDDKSNYQSSALANMYKVTASDMNEIKSVVNAVVDAIYPVGSIYMSVTDDTATKVQNRFGGTWTAWGTGRTPVCVDTGQTEFNSVEKTGGSKYLQAHTHTLNDMLGFAEGSDNIKYTVSYGYTRLNTGITTDSTGAGDSGNLQPYITCYMWKRVS